MSNSDDLNMNYLFGSVQICKVLFILNYGLKFFIYCATGSYFRNQLNQIKTKSIFSKILSFYYLYINYKQSYFQIIPMVIIDQKDVLQDKLNSILNLF